MRTAASGARYTCVPGTVSTARPGSAGGRGNAGTRCVSITTGASAPGGGSGKGDAACGASRARGGGSSAGGSTTLTSGTDSTGTAATAGSVAVAGALNTLFHQSPARSSSVGWSWMRGAANAALASMRPALTDCCRKSPTTNRALWAPCPQYSLRMVTRLSLKPIQAPATSCGCITMNQPSVLSWVVPVLPARSSPFRPKRGRRPAAVPPSTTPRSTSSRVCAAWLFIACSGPRGAKLSSTLWARSSTAVTTCGSM